jgi:hypothetical protein
MVVTVQQFAPQHMHVDTRYEQHKAELQVQWLNTGKFIGSNPLHCKVI